MTTRRTTTPRITPGRALLYGTLVVGTLDILEVIVFVGMRGVPPVRVLQSVASGVLGRGAYQGGLPAALLGTLLHFTIAFAAVALYQVASRRFGFLTRHPLVWGPLYGVGVWLVMNLIVVPLSAAAIGSPTPASIINGLLIHALGVGLPSALFARAAIAPAPAPERESTRLAAGGSRPRARV
ncbi:MAG TPA: hypothetical protein VF006_18470 [Longimicrobium sp.]